MIPRTIAPLLVSLSKQYPVVTLLGPRQSGKTTLTRHLFPHRPYVNLEDPDVRSFALSDGRGFIERYRQSGAIFDEIQRAPFLTSYIQGIVDDSKERGLFILTGSQQIALHSSVTQSLAGRTTLQELLPLSLQELATAGFNMSIDRSMLCGGLPRIFADDLDPSRAYRDYFQTYVERDVRSMLNVKDLSTFEKFMFLCAGRIGQLFNVSNLASEVGVTSATIQSWISILEASFITFRLHPYFENFGKRWVKTPKLYFYDVGLACSLLRIHSEDQLMRDPLRGQLFENLAILELLKGQYNRARGPDLYFFRDVHGHEVDLIIQHGRQLWPIEIKSSQTFNEEYLKNIRFFQNMVGPDRSGPPSLIYGGSLEHTRDGVQVLNVHHASRIIDRLASR